MANSRTSIHELHQVFIARFDRMDEKLDKLGERVSALEVWRAEIVGKMSIIAAGIAVVFSLTTDWIKKKLNI